MAITRAVVITLMRQRLGSWISAVGGVCADSFAGAGEGFNDPIAFALRQCGVMPASALAVTDDEVGQVASDQTDKLLDYVEYRVLVSLQQGFAGVDFTVGPRTEHWDQLGKRLAEAVKQRGAYLASAYGADTGAAAGSGRRLTAGTFADNYQESEVQA